MLFLSRKCSYLVDVHEHLVLSQIADEVKVLDGIRHQLIVQEVVIDVTNFGDSRLRESKDVFHLDATYTDQAPGASGASYIRIYELLLDFFHASFQVKNLYFGFLSSSLRASGISLNTLEISSQGTIIDDDLVSESTPYHSAGRQDLIKIFVFVQTPVIVQEIGQQDVESLLSQVRTLCAQKDL